MGYLPVNRPTAVAVEELFAVVAAGFVALAAAGLHSDRVNGSLDPGYPCFHHYRSNSNCLSASISAVTPSHLLLVCQMRSEATTAIPVAHLDSAAPCPDSSST